MISKTALEGGVTVILHSRALDGIVSSKEKLRRNSVNSNWVLRWQSDSNGRSMLMCNALHAILRLDT